jgi:N-sulfoglucosamine sulfohydrolase
MNILESSGAGRIDPQREYVLTGRERHVITAREGNVGYPIRALRTHDYLYIHNFEPDRWPAGDPVNKGSITGKNFADIDPSPSKEVLLENQNPGSPFYKEFLLACGLRPEHELYDIRRDPDCLDNIAERRKDIRDALWSKMQELLTEQGDLRMLGTGNTFDGYSGLLVNPTPDGK